MAVSIEDSYLYFVENNIDLPYIDLPYNNIDLPYNAVKKGAS